MEYKIEKPGNWQKMLWSQKIKYFASKIDEKYCKYVDKIMAKIEVIKLSEKVKIPKIIRILENCNDVKYSDLNSDYLIKASHGCGWNINLTKDFIKKENVIEEIKEQLNKWNKVYKTENEHHYKYLEPKFFIEEKVTDINNCKDGNIGVFMFRCIYGIPYTIGYKIGNKQNYYNINWQSIKEGELGEIEKPCNLDIMIEISKELSCNFEFVRIDLYNGIDGIYFSEFTFTPAGGSRIYSVNIEKFYGSKWI